MVNAAYDGRIADQLFQAAAAWNRKNQEDAYQTAADELDALCADQPSIAVKDLADYLIKAVRHFRPRYSTCDIINIFICLTQNFLTVFSGEPGTGKTSICNIAAYILGLSKGGIAEKVRVDGIKTDRYVRVSVERGWTSKRDFIGYYNPLSQTVEMSNKHLYDSLKILDKEGDRSQYPLVVLLDEANLSQIEFYWADFMNICDSGSADFISTLGSGRDANVITLGGEIQLSIPPTLRFAATINNDDTTERLSPRLLDRSALIRLPDGDELLPEYTQAEAAPEIRIISWPDLQAAFSCTDEELKKTSRPETYKKLLKALSCRGSGPAADENEVKRRKIGALRIDVSRRVDSAIMRYIAAVRKLQSSGVRFCRGGGKDEVEIPEKDLVNCAVDYAAAQRILPKINGSGDAYEEGLTELMGFCAQRGLPRCEKLLREIIDRGNAAMNYYSFF